MPEKTLVWTDTQTKKKYNVKYSGDVEPDERTIRQQLGLGAVKTYEYRHPDDGKVYAVKYTGDVPPSGDKIIEEAKPVRQVNAIKETASNVGQKVLGTLGTFLQGMAGGYRPPVPAGKAGTPVLSDRSRGPHVDGGRDPLLQVISPVAAPVMKAASTVGNSARNFAQGALAPGLDRFDSLVAAGQAPDMKTMGKAVFTDIPGNVKAGAKAVIHDNGDKQIGKRVPELAPDTLAGAVYNMATAAGSDPMNFIGAGAPELTEQAVRLAGKTATGRKAVAAAGALRELSKPGEVVETATRAGKIPGVRAPVPEGATVRPVRGGTLGRNPSPDAMAARERLDNVVAPGPGSPAKPFTPRPPVKELPHVLLDGRKPTPIPSERVAQAVESLGAPPRSQPVGPPRPASTGAVRRLATKNPNFQPVNVAGKTVNLPVNAKGVGQAVLNAHSEIDGTMRGMSYGGDLSAPLRQGAILGVTRPVQASKAFVAQVRAFKDPAAFDSQMAEIAARPTAPLHKDFGLYVPDAEAKGADLLKREEVFTSSLAHKIPVVREVVGAGDRAITAYLTRLRADVFDSTADAWTKAGITPETHPEEYKALATWINTATGRGGLGPLEPHAETLSKVFSSPRLQSSRLSVLTAPLNPATYTKMPKASRLLMLRDIGSFVGANAGLIGLAKVYSDSHPDSAVKVTGDLRSGDFGGVRLGQSKVDLTAGIAPWVKLFGQEWSGEKTNSKGETKPADRMGTALKFAEGRLSPLNSLIVEAMRGTTYDGKEFDPVSDTAKRFIPLFSQDLRDAMREHGAALGGALGVGAGLGGGVQTYESDDEKNAKPKPFNVGEEVSRLIGGRPGRKAL